MNTNQQKTYISIMQAAKTIAVNRSTIYRMIQAREYAELIARGKAAAEDAPEQIAIYLDAGFPLPYRIGASSIRIDADELQAWINSRRIASKALPEALQKNPD